MLQSLLKRSLFRPSTTVPFFVSVFLSTLVLLHLLIPFITYEPLAPLSSPSYNATRANEISETELRSRLLLSLPPCASSGRASTFLMVFMGHSGSTALMTSLAQHSMFHIPSFEPVDHGLFLTLPDSEASLKALKYTTDFFTNVTALDKIPGFKIRPRQLLSRPGEFASLFKRFSTRIVWSYRSNMLKQALGDYNIKFNNDPSAYEGIKLSPNGSALSVAANGETIDKDRRRTFRVHSMDEMHRLMKNRVIGDGQVLRALQKIGVDGCVLPVSYESYLRRPEMTLERVQTFLGVGTEELHPALRAKATKDSICELVENWEELCEAFFACDVWRWMLDDFDNGCSCSALRPSRFSHSQKYCAIA